MVHNLVYIICCHGCASYKNYNSKKPIALDICPFCGYQGPWLQVVLTEEGDDLFGRADVSCPFPWKRHGTPDD